MKLVISPDGDIKQMTVAVNNHQIYSDAIYLDSPLYWKLKDKLELNARDIIKGEQYLSGVPQYFLEILDKIRLRKITKQNGDAKFREELLAKLERIIGGKIIRDQHTGAKNTKRASRCC